MNALTTTETRSLQAPQQQNTNALALNADSLDSMMRVAELMASGRSTVPAHLQKSPADCMAVVMQALQWGLNPFAVAQKTHIVSGHLGYEGQLVNAVIQTSGSIDGRFHYEFRGNPGSIECRVGAVIHGESEITWGEWLSEAKVTTKNSPLWKTNPKQQLGYLQVKNWARLYCPGAILGVYTPDEFEATSTPTHAPHATDGHNTSNSGGKRNVLLEAATQSAQQGIAAYQRFWAGSSKEARHSLRTEHERLKAMAAQADRERTVNAPEQAIDAQAVVVDTDAAPAAQGRPKRQFDDVLASLCQAKNLEQLYAAAAHIDDVHDGDNVAMLNAKYEELLEKLTGEAHATA